MNSNDQLSDRALSVLLRELKSVLDKNVSGEVVELGCYKGLTSIEIQKFLKEQGSDKKLYLYDSFEGLPEKQGADQSPAGSQFKAGELYVSKREVVEKFKRTSLPLPIIYKTWFKDISDEQLPKQISFAFLDGDFYESIKDSLLKIWPLLDPKAVIVVDDYANQALPGASKAVNEWLSTHKLKLRVEARLAIIHPEAD